MSKWYIIDGYNVLHAMGAIKGKLGPGGLEQARKRLLGLLTGTFEKDTSRVTVVFDASHSPAGDAEQSEHGLTVLFATKFDQADDLIEELIRQHSSPKNLIVVSDDHRLQSAARRRGAQGMPSPDFLTSLRHIRKGQSNTPDTDKQPGQTEKDKQDWLDEFKDLESDPKLREFFEGFPE